MYCQSCFHLFLIQTNNYFTHFGLKNGLFQKNSKQKSYEGLDKFILSRYAKFHCLTLSSYGGDSGTNKVRTQNIEHRTYIGSLI